MEVRQKKPLQHHGKCLIVETCLHLEIHECFAKLTATANSPPPPPVSASEGAMHVSCVFTFSSSPAA